VITDFSSAAPKDAARVQMAMMNSFHIRVSLGMFPVL
jgi:hypothetical protein